jgi:hypothetical protein
MGDPRGYAPLVAGQSPRRGGRERSERWKGEVSSPSKESMGKTSGLTFQIPCQLLYHGFRDAYVRLTFFYIVFKVYLIFREPHRGENNET